MPSPFPGMDPYIEDPEIWSDFHGNIAPEIQSQLNQAIRPRYIARLTPHVTYEVIEVAELRGIRPDVAIWQAQSEATIVATAQRTITPAPAESQVPLEVPLRLYTV